MKIDILTLFPEMFGVYRVKGGGPFSKSIVKRACDKGLLDIHLHNIRDYATDKHKTVDDMPYGGGAGMVLRVDVIDAAILKIKKGLRSKQKSKIILLTPQGQVFNQKIAQRLSKLDDLILICGHYEGFDERVRKLVDMEISIGDYILTGGELPAMVLVDTVARLIPGVLGKKESLHEESFNIEKLKIKDSKLKISNYLLEYSQYTRPKVYNGMKIPKVLLSGNHQRIAEWRQKQAIKRTKKQRPDLLK
jgi:tRNA (guanine37-N1)-methyltransferase